MYVPYYDIKPQQVFLKEQFLQKVAEILDTGNFILGPEVEALEHNFSKYCEIPYVIACSNGTTALHMASQLLNIRPGDEVITTAFTFAATSWCISYMSATPVYVDIDPATFNIDPKCIEAAITAKTKAIIVVHLYGHPCDMDPIVSICKKYDLQLIEDAAQAHGAIYKDRKVGAWGAVTTFSFYPTKNLGACGEGGALAVHNPSLAKQARLLRSHGSNKRYIHEMIGYNYRMEALQGAFLNLKLPYLEQWNAERSAIAALYNQQLAGLPLILPHQADWAKSVYHLYTIRTSERARLLEHLEAHNIGWSTHYPLPLHLQPCYAHLGYKKGSLPETEKAADTVVNLPIFPGMTQSQIEYVTESLKLFFNKS